jgi:hypothetical protein
MKKTILLNISLLMFFSCSQDEQNQSTAELCFVHEYRQNEEYSEVYYSDTQLVIVSNLNDLGEEEILLTMETLDLSKCSDNESVKKDTLTSEEINSKISQLGLRKIESTAIVGHSVRQVNSFFKKRYRLISDNKGQTKILVSGRENNSSIELSSDGVTTSFHLDDGFNYELYHLESDKVSNLVIQTWKPNSVAQLTILRL